jgi:DNA-directed RNA polymerase subunit M/transcription elongation factor TFIIS
MRPNSSLPDGTTPYSPTAFRMLLRSCPSCRAMMRLWRIEPKLNETRVDTHFFECLRCGHTRSEDISRVPLARAC